MTTLNMPTKRGFSSASFGLVASTQVFQSPLSGQTQTLDLGWEFWQASFVLKPMKAMEAGPWKAFLTQLRGRAGRFYGFDPLAQCGCGALGTSVKGVPASGTELAPSVSLAPSELLAPGGTYHPGWDYPTTLNLSLYASLPRGATIMHLLGMPDGFDWSHGVNHNYDPSIPVVCSGSYVQVGGELKMLTSGLYLSSCGGTRAAFTPAMRSAVSAGVRVIVDGAVVEMRLVDDGQALWSESPGGIYNISFAAVEAI